MAAMTLLTLAQEFCKRRSLPVPVTVSGAQDETTLQIWGLMNEGIMEVANRFEWPLLTTRYTFIHANGTGYNALDVSAAGPIPDYVGMLNRTFWDTIGRREVYGPLAPKDVEIILNLNIQQAVYQWWNIGQAIRVYPVPAVPASNPFAFEYLSSYGVLSGTTPAEMYTADTDTCRFPNNWALADLTWRYNALKGLPYAEQFRMCESIVQNLQGRQPAPDIVMDPEHEYNKVAGPGLYIAAGSWPLP